MAERAALRPPPVSGDFLDTVARAADPSPSDIEHARTLAAAAHEHFSAAFAFDEAAVLNLRDGGRHVSVKTKPGGTAHQAVALEALLAAVATDGRLRTPMHLDLALLRPQKGLSPVWLLDLSGWCCFQRGREDAGMFGNAQLALAVARCRALERSGIMPDEMPGRGHGPWRAQVSLATDRVVLAYGDTPEIATDNALRTAAFCQAVLNPGGVLSLTGLSACALDRLHRDGLARLSGLPTSPDAA